MIVALYIVAAVAVCVPIILAALVSVASRREDRAWTLTEPAAGPARSVARRLVGLRSRNAEWLQQAGRRDRRRAVGQPAIPWRTPDDQRSCHRMAARRPGDTYPLSANQRADSSMASRAGREV
jgi:hypothetical protein